MEFGPVVPLQQRTHVVHQDFPGVVGREIVAAPVRVVEHQFGVGPLGDHVIQSLLVLVVLEDAFV